MSVANIFRANLVPCTGLIIPPVLWAINTQLGQVLPYAECGATLKYAALVSLVLVVASGLSGYASWRAMRLNRSDAEFGISAYSSSFVFVATISVMMAAVFAFAILLQGLSSVVLSGCER